MQIKFWYFIYFLHYLYMSVINFTPTDLIFYLCHRPFLFIFRKKLKREISIFFIFLFLASIPQTSSSNDVRRLGELNHTNIHTCGTWGWQNAWAGSDLAWFCIIRQGLVPSQVRLFGSGLKGPDLYSKLC